MPLKEVDSDFAARNRFDAVDCGDDLSIADGHSLGPWSPDKGSGGLRTATRAVHVGGLSRRTPAELPGSRYLGVGRIREPAGSNARDLDSQDGGPDVSVDLSRRPRRRQELHRQPLSRPAFLQFDDRNRPRSATPRAVNDVDNGLPTMHYRPEISAASAEDRPTGRLVGHGGVDDACSVISQSRVRVSSFGCGIGIGRSMVCVKVDTESPRLPGNPMVGGRPRRRRSGLGSGDLWGGEGRGHFG